MPDNLTHSSCIIAPSPRFVGESDSPRNEADGRQREGTCVSEDALSVSPHSRHGLYLRRALTNGMLLNMLDHPIVKQEFSTLRGLDSQYWVRADKSRYPV